MTTVFLSSTSKDLSPYRDAAYTAIEGLDGFHCVRMEGFGARNISAKEFCQQRISGCELVVCLIGLCYGSTAPGSDESYTVLEYRTAEIARIPRLVFVSSDGNFYPGIYRESDDQWAKQQAFRQEVSSQCIRETFIEPHDLARKVVTAIRNWEQERKKPLITQPDYFEHRAVVPGIGIQAFDHIPCLHASLADLDLGKVSEFLKRDLVQRQEKFLPGGDIQTQLDCLCLLHESRPTYGTLLCFGQKPQTWLAGATTRCVYWRGNTRHRSWLDDRVCRGDLLAQFESVLNFFRKNLRFSRIIGEEGRTEQYEIPLVALQEAVANALVHREYAIWNGKEYIVRTDGVQVEVFDDRVEIKSPGSLPFQMTLDLLHTEGTTCPRNPQIARIFYLYSLVEQVGSGIQRMEDAMEDVGLPLPQFELSDAQTFKVILKRPQQIPDEIFYSTEFGGLLTLGLEGIVEKEGKPLELMIEEISNAMSLRHTFLMQKWRQGRVPILPDQVATLARMCVQVGGMDQAWLHLFLRAAHYPTSDTLIAELYPISIKEHTKLQSVSEALSSHILSDEDIADLHQHYCHTLYEYWKMQDFKGILYIERNRPMSIPLTEVFVFPDVLVGVPEYETLEREDERESDERKGKKSARVGENEQELLGSRERRSRKETRMTLQREELGVVLAKSHRLVILGDPGAGKSTLLKYLMLRLAQSKEQFITDFPQLVDVSAAAPLYIRLSEYAEAWRTASLGERALKDFLPRYLYENYLEPYIKFIQTQLERGAVFLLLDGLDEIPDVALRMQIVRQVEAFTQFYSKNRFIVTSRIVGYKEAQLAADYQAYTLADFNDKQICTFTQKWCPAYERWVKRAADSPQLQDAANKEAERLFQETQKNPGVRKLAVNPLLLTILAIIQRQGTKLPSHRITLYELCATTLLDNWIEAKGISVRFNQNDLVKILRRLAIWMHEHKAGGAIPEEELTEQIVKQLLERRVTRDEGEAARLAEQFLETVRGQTGILVERGKQRYGFLHQTFEEYFAARELIKRKEQERNDFIRAHLHDARWREVILLAVGIIGILDSNEEEVTELVNDVILQAGSPFEEWLYRDLLFAGLCLADDVGVNRACEDDIIERIVYLYLTSPYDALREAFSSVLKAWDGTQAARKAACLVLTLFHNPEMLTAPQSVSLIVSSSEEAQFAQKIVANYQRLVQLYQQSQTKLLHMSVLMILHTLQVETPTAPIEYAVGMFSDSSWQVRQAAANALGQLGSSAPHVLDALLHALSDPSEYVRQTAVNALGQLGSSAPHVLDALLSDTDQDVRRVATTALGQLSSSAPQKLDDPLHALSDSSEYVRQAAANALGQLGSSVPQELDALLTALLDTDQDVRQATATALGQLGSSQPATVKYLFAVLSDTPITRLSQASIDAYKQKVHSDSRLRQVKQLEQFGTGQPRVLDVLLTALSDSSWQVRQAAASALGQLGSSAPAVLDALLATLSDSSWQVRQAAASALGQLGSSAPAVLDALLHGLSDPDPDVRQAAATALGQLGSSAPAVLDALLTTLSDSSWQVRRAAATALGQLGSSAPAVLDALLHGLSDPDPDVRQAAATALGQLGSSAPAVLDALLHDLSDSYQPVRQAAASALGQLGSSAPAVLDALLTTLSDSSWQVRHAAASALGQLGSSQPSVLDALLHGLSDTDEDVRHAAASALGQLGSSQPSALDALLSALSDSSWQVRQAAATALVTLRIDRMAVASHIEGLLRRDEHIASNQFVADRVSNSLLFALQQVIGEV